MTVRIKPLASLLIAAVITASTFGAIGRSAAAQADLHRTPIAHIASHGITGQRVAMRCLLTHLLQKA